MNERLRDLMSGNWRGPTAALLRAGLATGEIGYRAAVDWRNRRYDRGIDVHRAAAPVVSVGNITAGGTGKTPVVAMIAQHFHRRGVRVALLSRGYRSLEDSNNDGAPPATENDEARVLARLCPGIPHRQQADRVAGAAAAIRGWSSELLILDDGFQHRRLARDLDIVLIDATNPFGHDHVLPRGLLREPVTALRRADLILLTRVDAVPKQHVERLHDQLATIAPEIPVADVIFPPVSLVNASGRSLPLEALEQSPILAFCGIGNPASFAATLAQAGIHPAEPSAFPDHHHYRADDLTRLSHQARARNVAAAVTTMKDLVKIKRDTLPDPSNAPLWAVETGCDIVSNKTAVLSRLDALITKTKIRRAA